MKANLLILFFIAIFSPGWCALVDEADEIYDFDNDATAEKSATRDLTSNGTPTYSSSDKKQGTHSSDLDGSTDYFSLSDDATFDVGAGVDFTIAFWVKFDTNKAYIARKGGGAAGSGPDGWEVERGFSSGERFRLNVWDGWSETSNVALDVTVSTGTWYHVVWSYDSDSTTNNLDCYISTTSFDSSVEEFSVSGDPTDSSNELQIGRAHGGYTAGHIDEFVFMNGYAVNATEAESIYDGSWRSGAATAAQIIMLAVS